LFHSFTEKLQTLELYSRKTGESSVQLFIFVKMDHPECRKMRVDLKEIRRQNTEPHFTRPRVGMKKGKRQAGGRRGSDRKNKDRKME